MPAFAGKEKSGYLGQYGSKVAHFFSAPCIIFETILRTMPASAGEKILIIATKIVKELALL